VRRLTVDLRSHPPPPRWAWGVAGVLFAAAIVLGVVTFRESQKLDALKAQKEELLRQLAEPAKPSPVVTQKMPYDASAREMLALATSEWPAMLTALESVEIVGVTPTSVEIAVPERWIRVEVEFADYEKLLAYVDGLNAGEPRPRWVLLQAQSNTRSGSASSSPLSMSTASVKGAW
jgi:hypothetical protein